jgi:MFS family permease
LTRQDDRVLRRLMVDVTPLRVSAPYRRLWFGTTVAAVGQQMTAVAVAIQVYAITGSSFAVGMVGAAAFVPLVVFGLYGGAISDSHDRRTVALVASLGLWACSMVLLVQAWQSWDRLAVLYAVTAVQSGFFAVNNPARSAMLPRLLDPQLLPAANALSTVTWNLGFTLGPLLGGAVIAGFDLTAAYAIDVVTYLAAVYGVVRLPAMAPQGEVARVGLRSVLEGLRFLRSRKNLLMTFMVDLAAMVLAQPRALFPAMAATVYGGGARTVGLLSAAWPLGSLVAAAFSGWLGRVRFQGRMVVAMVIGYGVSIALFGLAGSLWMALLFLAVSGGCDMVSAVFRSTILQVATPDELRGRLQGVFIVVVAGGPKLGDTLIGTTAATFGEMFAIVAGGTACVVAATALAVRFPAFMRYDARHPVP